MMPPRPARLIYPPKIAISLLQVRRRVFRPRKDTISRLLDLLRDIRRC